MAGALEKEFVWVIAGRSLDYEVLSAYRLRDALVCSHWRLSGDESLDWLAAASGGDWCEVLDEHSQAKGIVMCTGRSVAR